MGQILLVRHGQASWGAEDYDVLSPTGEEQSGVVGRALAHLSPDLVVHGAMKRQRRTAELAAEAAGWQVATTTDDRWDEMDHHAMLAVEPPPFDGEPDRHQFQAWYEAATRRWTSGEHDDAYEESFPAFRTRVHAALEELRDASCAVVFTSGGPVSSVATQLLEGDTATYVRTAPVVVNTSVTRIISGRRGLTLLTFNEHGHLPTELLTYR